MKDSRRSSVTYVMTPRALTFVYNSQPYCISSSSKLFDPLLKAIKTGDYYSLYGILSHTRMESLKISQKNKKIYVEGVEAPKQAKSFLERGTGSAQALASFIMLCEQHPQAKALYPLIGKKIFSFSAEGFFVMGSYDDGSRNLFYYPEGNPVLVNPRDVLSVNADCIEVSDEWIEIPAALPDPKEGMAVIVQDSKVVELEEENLLPYMALTLIDNNTDNHYLLFNI